MSPTQDFALIHSQRPVVARRAIFSLALASATQTGREKRCFQLGNMADTLANATPVQTDEDVGFSLVTAQLKVTVIHQCSDSLYCSAFWRWDLHWSCVLARHEELDGGGHQNRLGGVEKLLDALPQPLNLIKNAFSKEMIVFGCSFQRTQNLRGKKAHRKSDKILLHRE